MPRTNSTSDTKRSSPTQRHSYITSTRPSSISGDRPQLTPSSTYTATIDNPNSSLPTYSETILQPPTIATDHPLTQSNLGSLSESASSRRHSSSSMRNASMTFETIGPSQTPTGRISKAKKGKRVHACEFPGCGKVFTRAEHRRFVSIHSCRDAQLTSARRHELNHNPEASFRCQQPSCGKSFHRIDLLQRHQERHDLDAAGAQHAGTIYASPPSVLPSTSMASSQHNDSLGRAATSALPIGSLVNPPHRGYTADAALGMGIQMPYMTAYTTAEDPYFYGSESSSHSPTSDNFGHYPHRQSISCSSSVAAFDHSAVSPMMTSSIPNPWMPASAPPSTLPTSMFDESAAYSVTVSSFLGYPNNCPLAEADQSPTVSAMPIPLSELDGHEWTAIQRELSQSPGLIFDSTGSSNVVRWGCLDLYWHHFHSAFPIIHKPTFFLSQPSPLVLCATLAIGSLYDTLPDSKLYSATLQDIATKLLRERHVIHSRSRISDLQTVVLLEILGKYCAMKISVETTPRFRSLFASFHQSLPWLATSPLAVYKTLKEDRHPEDVVKAKKFWINHETRQRIFQACTVVDAQQVALFGQQPTIIGHKQLRNAGVHNKHTQHLPCSDKLWEATSDRDWLTEAAKYVYEDIQTARANYKTSSVNDYSLFQHQIINCNTSSDQRCSEEISSPSRTEIFFSKTRFNYHVFQMAGHTPVRALLIVAGESWFLGRKIESEAEYEQAQHDVRAWVTQSSALQQSKTVPTTLLALWHALKVLRMLDRKNERSPEVFHTTHMLHEDWAVYLATLVCWAHGYLRGFTQTICAEFGPAQAKTVSFSGTPRPLMDGTFSAYAPPPHAVAIPTPPPSIATNRRQSATTTAASTPYDYIPSTASTATFPSTATSSAYLPSTPMLGSNYMTPQSYAASTVLDDPSVAEMRAYLSLTDVHSPQALASIAPLTLGRTQGLIDTVRVRKFGHRRVVNGLINNATRVLYRLTQGGDRGQTPFF